MFLACITGSAACGIPGMRAATGNGVTGQLACFTSQTLSEIASVDALRGRESANEYLLAGHEGRPCAETPANGEPGL